MIRVAFAADTNNTMKIFFDLDGPILDNRRKYHAIYTSLLERGHHAALSVEEYWDCKRRKIPEAEILAKTSPPEFFDEYSAERMRIIEDLEYLKLDIVWPGIPELLDSWSREHDLFVVTMRNRRDMLLRQLDHFDLRRHFREILNEDTNAGTADVKARLMTPYISNPTEAVMIGDTEPDIRAGQRVGIRTVAVTCGIRTREHLETAQPDHFVRHATDITLAWLTSARA